MLQHDERYTGSTSRPSLVIVLSLHGFWFAFHDIFRFEISAKLLLFSFTSCLFLTCLHVFS